jgi:thienamycin biosynthesis protein ThnN
MEVSLNSTNTVDTKLSQRLRHIIGIHFDKDTGAPYWLDKQKEIGADMSKSIQCVEDLSILGPMDEEALATRPVEDFIPRIFRQEKDYILAETAGTLGRPKFAIHREDEFQTAFITPFVKAARHVSFPSNCRWLFVGPTGPHIIGRAARACARQMNAGDVFTVDFDPRWAKKLPVGSFASQRYLEHIEAQALRVLEVQNIGVLFSTPIVLSGLAKKMDKTKRRAIEGIHLGGMSAGVEFMDKMSELFPNAVILSGYGNTLFGMMPQLNYDRQTGFDYFPYGHRLMVKVIPIASGCGTINIGSCVGYGQRGQLVVHRLDEMQFIANFIERDSAIRIQSNPNLAADGFMLDGIRDPQPIIDEKTKPSTGLY